MRRVALLLLPLALLVCGCDLLSSGDDAVPVDPAETIRIASFNIQVFGTSKEKKPEVMRSLVQIVRKFDVIAIQEIRSSDQGLIPRFMQRVNADGGHYRHVLGPRLGRTSSKEQYVFIYNAARIELIDGSVETVSDPADRLHREPLIARFRVRGPPKEEAFTFTLVNIHTDPDEVKQEVDALADVFQEVQRQYPEEDDVILLGDLNASSKKLRKLGKLPGMRWVIESHQKTNTRLTKSYDNILFDRRATVEYLGSGGVMNLMQELGISKSQAIRVSDHMPVWATFGIRENRTGRIATGTGRRRD